MYKELCDFLNNILSVHKENFVNELNDLLYEYKIFEGDQLYWDHELWIDCNFDDIDARNLVVEHPELVMFVPSDDPKEHPGVVVTYKK